MLVGGVCRRMLGCGQGRTNAEVELGRPEQDFMRPQHAAASEEFLTAAAVACVCCAGKQRHLGEVCDEAASGADAGVQLTG